jgi:hypothetical protein
MVVKCKGSCLAGVIKLVRHLERVSLGQMFAKWWFFSKWQNFSVFPVFSLPNFYKKSLKPYLEFGFWKINSVSGSKEEIRMTLVPVLVHT